MTTIFFVAILALVLLLVKFNFAKSLFGICFLAFLLTGGLQSILVYITGSLQLSDALGFTASNRFSSFKPRYVDGEILGEGLVLWAIFYIFIYFTLHYLRPRLKLEKAKCLHFHMMNPLCVFAFLMAVMNVVLFLLHKGIYNYFSILVAWMILPILLMVFHLFQYPKNRNGNILLLFTATWFLYLLPYLIEFSRGGILLSIIPFMTLWIFVCDFKRMSWIKFLVPSILIFSILISLTVYKYWDNRVEKDIDFQTHASVIQSSSVGFMGYFATVTLMRLNNIQGLYWYLFDKKYDEEVFVVLDQKLALYPIIQFFNGDSSISKREVYGYPLESYLFEKATFSGNKGGFALHPLVEYLWIFNSKLIGLTYTSLAYLLVAVVSYILLRLSPIYIYHVFAMLYPVYLNPESITFISRIPLKIAPIAFCLLLILKFILVAHAKHEKIKSIG